jgi:hypothetical protein
MKSWHLKRRTFLRAAGVSVALPLLESMSVAAEAKKDAPARLCYVFFPFGVPMPPESHADRQKHGWFPVGEGRDFQFTGTHESLTPLRDQLTYFGGLSHPLGRRVPGHKAGDVYLTGADISGSAYRQSVSVDQIAAMEVGEQTRLSSLVLSTSGGVNRPYRSYTLSYDRDGRPVPAEHKPQEIFRRLFGAESTDSLKKRRNQFLNHASILDAIGEEARDLNRRLGSHDRQKMEEYLASVRDVEKRVQRADQWLKIPKPKVDPAGVNLDVGPDGPKDFIRSMYDLITLAFQADTTRVSTYQTASEEGNSIATNFPHAAGIQKSAHAVSHQRTDYEQWSTYSKFLVDQHAYFLERLKSIQEGEGSLLDNTMVLYGCCTSQTHVSRNYPLVLAGGGNLGINHGRYLKFDENKVPMSNLFVTMLDKMNVPVERFKDSNSDLSDLLS